MPLIKFDGIAEKSSEDSKRQLFADNLLRTNDFKSWKCKEWQEMAYVVLELKEPQKVDNIEIGNDCSAFIEVLVANSSDLKPRFQVLLSTSSFMTPSESKSLNNTNRIREFPKEKLSPNSRNEKWNRFKIVCKQPFNREISYGLSFVRFNYKDDEPEEDVIPKLTFGPFRLRSAQNKDNGSDSETNSGSLFAKRNNPTDNNNTSKPPTLTSAVGLTSSSQKASKPKQNYNPSNGLTSKQSSSPITSPKTSQIQRQPIAKTTNSSPSTSSNERQPVPSPPKRQRIAAQNKPFDRLMSGIVFSLSGFVNPKRSEIRDKAIKMGAKYRPDWDQSCTHLICAFENTPKFKEVKTRKGRIVTEKWILDSFNQKKLISWKKYILGQTSDDEEDDDIEEEDEPYVPSVQNNRKKIQYIDDEEEEDSQIREVIGFDPNKTQNQSNKTDNDFNDDIYDMETDNE